jgi:hypothetical protein
MGASLMPTPICILAPQALHIHLELGLYVVFSKGGSYIKGISSIESLSSSTTRTGDEDSRHVGQIFGFLPLAFSLCH